VIREGHIVKQGVTAELVADPDIHRTFLGV
jgi:ABC-type lipopolysaccharide export system ATPase subunit